MSIFDNDPTRRRLSILEALTKGLGPEKPKFTLSDLARGGVFDIAPPPVQSSLAALLAKSRSPLGLMHAFGPRPDTEEFIQAAWEKASRDQGFDANVYRRDRFGALIARSDYGQQTLFGWHIDHIVPKSKGGSDELFNREPLYWRNNLAKSDRQI